ncbi:unnamed protein product [Brassicogethes aeneus]|uniref:Uncharacterized protein n=1 Tax=Brassicogethes aeneus TaxID=1431903 RepID=A0A9P0FKP1_BRAAE|nr:unnamed protein product [Brassicogethes aeneus]
MNFNVNLQNKDSICRFCLESNEKVDFPLFIEKIETDFHDVLKAVNIIVVYNENLPSSICNACRNAIESFHKVKSQIHKNEEFLTTIYTVKNSENVKTELIYEESELCFSDNDEDYKPAKARLKKHSIKCELCNKRIAKENIKEHELLCGKEDEGNLVEEIKSYTCNICGNEYGTEVRLSLHYIQHVMYDSDKKIDFFLFCNYCGHILNNKDEYLLHIQDYHREISDKWQCKVCDVIFDTEFTLMKHIHHSDECKIITTHINSAICLLCKKEVSEPLTYHIKQHLLKRYTCRICQEKYITSIGYNTHLKKHSQYKYSCEHCCKVFISKKNIAKHTKEIHNSDHFVCEVCSKVFTRKHNLTLHKKHTHDDKYKNFICSICAYATNSNSELRKHERLHSNERPFKCTFDNCNKSYKTSSHLSHHIKTHLNIRNFVCEYCDKSFYTSKNLKHHILSHTGVRDFKCSLCDQTFKRRDQLTAHMKKRHGCF